MYSATPGGDLHPISLTPQQVRVCLCGHPYKPEIVQALELIPKLGVSRREMVALMECLLQRLDDALETPISSPRPTPPAGTEPKKTGRRKSAGEGT